MSLPAHVAPLVRHFSSNGMKFLFSRGDNVADLVRWRAPDLAARIDFDRAQVQPDTFVAPAFANLESDVLLRAPLRRRKGAEVQVFILIENQAEPDDLMRFRALQYVVLVYEQQIQLWMKDNNNLRDFRFHPVMPIVFYTGRRTWDSMPTISSVVHEGDLFGTQIPEIEPVFINLARAPEVALKQDAGMLGWVLWLIRQSKLKRSPFSDVLGEVIGRLDGIADEQRERWEQFLWFSHALVYHSRGENEWEALTGRIRDAVRDAKKEEASGMKKTIAEALEEKGELRGLRRSLLRTLRTKFETVPADVEAKIEATTDPQKLDNWLASVLTAKKLSDVPFNN